jgi:hypothetical protein
MKITVIPDAEPLMLEVGKVDADVLQSSVKLIPLTHEGSRCFTDQDHSVGWDIGTGINQDQPKHQEIASSLSRIIVVLSKTCLEAYQDPTEHRS